MRKKLLIYRWGSLSEPSFCRAAQKAGYDYVEFARTMTNYHADAAFAGDLIACIHANRPWAVFSYDYFPLLSMICQINQIPYIAWIYDCPQYTLQSRTLTNAYNYIFCFDRIYAERLQAMGAKHCCHYPLAGMQEFFEKAEKCSAEEKRKYRCDVSFVGNLYHEKKNRFRQVELAPYVRGFAEGLLQAQLLVYGCNFLKESLPASVIQEMVQKCELRLGDEYVNDEAQMAADMLGMEVTGREREAVLAKAGQKYQVRLYTSSELPDALRRGRIEKMGFADYEKEVPYIYNSSKINLNITSKTIVSGIPQRVFDILSCGGFCLTNYQPEIAEYFIDGQELVMYSDCQDLMDKIDYYLNHEQERAQIAWKGREKLLKEFELKDRITIMLDEVEKNIR